MAERKVTYRLSAEGGAGVKAEFQGIGLAGQDSYDRIHKAASEAEKSARVFDAALKSEKQQFEQLRASVDPAYAAMVRFDRIKQQADRAVFNGIATQKQANAVMAQAERQMLAYSRTAEMADTVNRRSGRGLQNIALQLNQVGQQGMVTGNYMQALAIQMPDMLAGFGGLAPAIAGAGIALGVSLIPALIRGQKEAEKLEVDILSAFNSTKTAVDSAQEAQERYTYAVSLNAGNQRRVTAEVLRLLAAEAQARSAIARDSLIDDVRQRDALVASIAERKAAFEAELQAQTEQLDRVFDLRREAMGHPDQDVGRQFIDTEQERARVRLAQQFVEQNQAAFDEMRKQNRELDLVNSQIAKGHGEAVKVVDELRKAADEGGRFASTISAVDLSGIGSQAAFLAQQMGIAADRAAVYNAVLNQQAGIKVPQPKGKFSFNLGDADNGDMGVGFASVGFRNVGLNMPPPRSIPGYIPRGPSRVERDAASSGGRAGGASAADRTAQKEHNELLREKEAIYRATRTEAEKYNEAVARASELLARDMIDQETYDRQMKKLDETLRGASDGVREWESLVTSGKDAVIDAFMGQANAADRLAEAIKRAAVEYALFGSGPLAGVFGGGGGLLSGVLGAVTSLPSFDGGGDTHRGARVGGLDGKGGFLSILHPKERVEDMSRTGSKASRDGDLVPFVGLGDGVQVQWLRKAQLQTAQTVGLSSRAHREGLGGALNDYQARGI